MLWYGAQNIAHMIRWGGKEIVGHEEHVGEMGNGNNTFVR